METKRVALNVLRRDKEALELLAAQEGEAMAVVLRRLIREAARKSDLRAGAGTGTQPERERDGNG